MKTIAATAVISTLLVLALSPTQLQGLPGHLRTHDGSTAENQEMERALIETLLSIAQHKDTAARVQRPPVEQQQAVGATDEQKSQVVSQANRTALTQQILSQYYHTWARNQRGIQNRRGQSTEKSISRQSGVTIEYCGAVGDIIQNAITFGLGFIPGGDSAYGIYIACAEQPMYPCTTVTVAVPANSIKADIDVCDYGNKLNGDICVYVYAESCTPSFLAFNLPITVPVGTKQVAVTIKVDPFNGCASVDVGAPKCETSKT